MNNKNAIISGGGSLALAFYEQLLANGWNVVLLSKSKPENFKGNFYICDFTRPQEIVEVVQKVQQDTGEINLVIHTAVSKITRKKSLEILHEDFKEAFQVDVFGGFVFLQTCAKYMKIQKFGQIFALTTEAIESKEVPSGMTGYICAKYALKGLLKILHQELLKDGVSVSALAPGFIDNNLNSDILPRLVEFIREKQNGELVTPEKVSQVLTEAISLPFRERNGKTFIINHTADPKNLVFCDL